MRLQIVFGNQLFPPELLMDDCPVFMAETDELCTYFKFHKQKIQFFLAAMREYRDEVQAARSSARVFYHSLDEEEGESQSYEYLLLKVVKALGVEELVTWEIEDKFMELRIVQFAQSHGLKLLIRRSPMFLTSRVEFETYLKLKKRPFMKSFYEGQRRRFKILMDPNNAPIGGKFSFDSENRRRIPKSVTPPPPKFPQPTQHVRDVAAIVEKRFSGHPGSTENFWLPVRRSDAEAWLEDFLQQRFREFGAFEDALSSEHDFVFHSAISPMLNTGLLTPLPVIESVLAIDRSKKIPINSTEGFIRQVIGWREFVRGIYQNFSERQERDNYFQHHGKLTAAWYNGTTGIPPLDLAIKKCVRFGWCHHIERLMVISNIMLLLRVDPREAHRWFMEMFVDSSDWVMGPNVFGMGQFSDGGIFATKPYVCGSNYLLKMGTYEKGDWCRELDALYWSFVETNREFYLKNPRTSMIVRTFDKFDPTKRAMFREIATSARLRLTHETDSS